MDSTLVCTIVFVAWIPLAVGIFVIFSPLRALLIAALAGVLFLPMAIMEPPFIPYIKATAIPLGLMAGLLLTDIGTLLRFRWRWFDVPMLMFCSATLWSGLINGFTFYDSAAAAATNFVMYGVAYFVGRIYLGDAAALHRFAMAIFYGGLIYIPFCVVEMRVGPEFHRWVYGFYAHPDYLQSIREGGYRPVVFMQHGLMVSLFMAAASLCGVWLRINKAMPKTVFYMPCEFWLFLLLAVTILCRSTGALVLMAAGLVVLLGTRPLRSYALALILAAAPVTYILARTGGWKGQDLVDQVGHWINQERADSLRNRLENGDMILAKALQKPILGWGPNGAEKIMDPIEPKKILATPDGMWDATLGQMGWFGLIGAYGGFLLPPLMLLWRFPRKTWGHPLLAAPQVLAVIGLLYALDNLMNNMVNPLYYLGLGGVATFAADPSLGAWPLPQRQTPSVDELRAANLRSSI